MEPLKPRARMKLLDLGADPADVLEYESLLAARFAEDPDAPPPPYAEQEEAADAVDEPPAAEPEDPSEFMEMDTNTSLQVPVFVGAPGQRDILTRGLKQRIDSLDDGGPGGAKAARRRASPQQRLEQLTRKLFPGGIKQG